MTFINYFMIAFHLGICVLAIQLAASKHRSRAIWFSICFFSGPIGFIILCVLPDGNLEDEVAILKAKVKQLENPNQQFSSLDKLSDSKNLKSIKQSQTKLTTL